MTTKGKQLSSSFSTGGGGARFEAHIQATFATLMLTGGCVPCLSPWPIVKILLQALHAGYRTDDLVVFVENPINKEHRRLLGQVKHSIHITQKNPLFTEVVRAAWDDFNDSKVFTKGKDVIALITGPINRTDIDGVNGLLEHARHTGGAQEFLDNIHLGHMFSDNVRKKLEAFRIQLKAANNGHEVTDTDLHEFLKHFHLLGYDLNKPGSVISSLMQSHIAQFDKDIPDKIWCHILSEVQNFNQNGGTISVETLPEDLAKYFREPEVTHIPKDLTQREVKHSLSDATDWSQHQVASKLSLAMLVGSWDEKKEADREVVEQLVGKEYYNWIGDIRESLQIHDCPLEYKNGLWRFKDRLKSWKELGGRLFDNQLDTFKTVVLDVLCVDDPSFELPGEERYAAVLHGKELPHSDKLREGLAETLALVGSQSNALIHCSQVKADLITALSIRELFGNGNWIRWGSLNSLLPILSEADPDEFLSAVEGAINVEPSPFGTLFEQEEAGVLGRSYISGLLWALEGIAWDENYLSRTSVILAELASHDPGGSWSNRPGNSLTDIFLPWLRHTLASVEKRQVALKTICTEQPEVGWKLLESLLPNQHNTTTGTHKPKWRNIVPEDWKGRVTNREYWDYVTFCANLIVEQAGFNVKKLASLTGIYDRLPPSASESLRNKLLSNDCLNLSEQDRLPIWNRLSKFVERHRRFPEAKWSLEDEALRPLEKIANKLAPCNPSVLHRRLFSYTDDDYQNAGDSDWQEQRFQVRKKAIKDILDEGGIRQVLEFASKVTNADLVGQVLADFDRQDFDEELLPDFLNMADQNIWSLVYSYVWGRRSKRGWEWFDQIDKTDWEPKQIASLLCALPFDRDAWDRVAQLPGENEDAYWKSIRPKFYQTDDTFPFVKLLQYGRPDAVIKGLEYLLIQGIDINPGLACKALLALVELTEQAEGVDGYEIVRIIKALQENPTTDRDQLFQVEWAYVSLLDGEGSPITLEDKLASDPDFFCELIRWIYRAKGDDSQEKPSQQHRNRATNAYRLLSTWRVVPGVQRDSSFHPEAFTEWLIVMEEKVKTSGHYDVAMIHLGSVLVNSPKGENGLWIHPVIASAMNEKDRSQLRSGYITGVRNSRGVYMFDPEAKKEKELANKFRQRAEETENSGYQRLATTLREIAESYDREAERILE